ncbi:MAG: DUF2064 domain-containing protein [Leifsonia sp.]
MTTLVVIAKECIPGRVKTRLNPPLSLEQAARLAAASLSDTFRAVASLPATRRILAFEGNLLPDGSEDYEVIPQSSGGLDMRLAAIFDRCSGPTVLIGMDTPQLTAELLDPAFFDWPSDVDAWFGPANDGGFWTLGLAKPDGSLIRGVPMSQDDTGTLQLRRLTDARLQVRMLPELVDVDTIADARQVAGQSPDSEFAQTLRSFDTGSDVSS